MHGPSTPTIADLAQFAAEHPQLELDPEYMSEAFVLAFDAPDEFGNGDLPNFRMVITSHQLMNHIIPEKLC